jgi:hypothetical protein
MRLRSWTGARSKPLSAVLIAAVGADPPGDSGRYRLIVTPPEPAQTPEIEKNGPSRHETSCRSRPSTVSTAWVVCSSITNISRRRVVFPKASAHSAGSRSARRGKQDPMDSTESVPLALARPIPHLADPFTCSLEIASQAPISFLHRAAGQLSVPSSRLYPASRNFLRNVFSGVRFLLSHPRSSAIFVSTRLDSTYARRT